MLKSLLTRIKSEKAQSSANKQQIFPEVTQPASLQKYLLDYQFRPLNENNIVKCNLHRIRYSVEPESPNLYNRILACPISVFNVLPYGKRKVKEICLKEFPCPQYISPLKNILKEELPTYNHLLINVYSPGMGIMPHFDGPMYKSKVVVLSLGGPAIINFSSNYGTTSDIASVLLEDRSVHIFEGEAYERCLHGIKQYTIDSIFLNLQKSEGPQGARIERSSVCNFSQTQLCRTLLKVFTKLDDKYENQVISEVLSKQCGVSVSFLSVKDNDDFNCKLEVARKERVSITVREKF